MSDDLLELELYLNSLYDLSYVDQNLSLIATNGHIKIKYTKNKNSSQMEIIGLTLNKPDKKYKVMFADEKFKINYENYNSLDTDFFDLTSLK